MSKAWNQQLKQAMKTAVHLQENALISIDQLAPIQRVNQKYEMLVGEHYLSLIDQRQQQEDPIYRQAIPDPRELITYPEESIDPIGDKEKGVTPILVHRYPDRVLLFPTFRCPMYCRYCFRKESLNQESIKLQQELPKALLYLQAHPEIKEVILTGGDPLMLGNEQLDELLSKLKAIPHIQRLRIHSRFPVTLPQRIDQALALLLGKYHPLSLVTHFNHPKEITPASIQAITLLQKAGMMVLNQSVLLKGVNDNVEILKTLFEGLWTHQIKPYYLHHPDQTPGTQHFRVSIERGLSLYQSLRGNVSGLAIPLYVLDIPGGGGKIQMGSASMTKTDQPFEWILTSPIDQKSYHYIDLGAKYEEKA